jgi:hypothetical protein
VAFNTRRTESLPAGFSLLGYENLQPSCRRCNSRKRADPFLPGRIAIELGVAGRAKRQINDLIDDFKKADQRDKLRFAIAGALDQASYRSAIFMIYFHQLARTKVFFD